MLLIKLYQQVIPVYFSVLFIPGSLSRQPPSESYLSGKMCVRIKPVCLRPLFPAYKTLYLPF
ncbi:hypothetical protein QE443_001675 [Pantoea ananatis]|nr:hypothetical protein [Pantoea ananatis]MDR6090024.1 hypothetical protein [Pantoea ananatis]PWV67516.1 hypothetical protein C7425_103563 [Pantoea ananatis]